MRPLSDTLPGDQGLIVVGDVAGNNNCMGGTVTSDVDPGTLGSSFVVVVRRGGRMVGVVVAIGVEGLLVAGIVAVAVEVAGPVAIAIIAAPFVAVVACFDRMVDTLGGSVVVLVAVEEERLHAVEVARLAVEAVGIEALALVATPFVAAVVRLGLMVDLPVEVEGLLTVEVVEFAVEFVGTVGLALVAVTLVAMAASFVGFVDVIVPLVTEDVDVAIPFVAVVVNGAVLRVVDITTLEVTGDDSSRLCRVSGNSEFQFSSVRKDGRAICPNSLYFDCTYLN